jgi:hypothetical protein
LIFGLCSYIPVIGWSFALMAIIYGIASLIKIHFEPELYTGKTKAIVGICLGVFGLIAGLIVVLLIFSI